MLFNILTLTEVKQQFTKPIDVFIAFCSFEKRCLSVVKNLPLENVNASVVFVNNDADAQSESLANLKEFEKILGDKSKSVKVDLFDPIKLTDEMISVLTEINKANLSSNLLVDITSFTHEALLIFLAVIKLIFKNAEIVYIYNNAATYASESENLAERWLSRGIKCVRSVLGYAGDIKPSQDTVLIMMLGYEYERAWRVIDTVSPEELIITYNDSEGSTTQLNCDAGEKHAGLLKELAAYYENPKQYVVSSNNPFKTAIQLEEIVNKIDEKKNIIIVPMNNKLSTVGAAIVAFKKPEIQLCYAPAEIYNTSAYSVEGDKFYIFSFDNEERNPL